MASAKSRRGLVEVRHASTSKTSRGSHAVMEGLDGLDLKTIKVAGFLVWASKPRSRPGELGDPGGGHVAPSQRLHRGEAKSPLSHVRPMEDEKYGPKCPCTGNYLLVYLGVV
jgi:hypothetical protein